MQATQSLRFSRKDPKQFFKTLNQRVNKYFKEKKGEEFSKKFDGIDWSNTKESSEKKASKKNENKILPRGRKS